MLLSKSDCISLKDIHVFSYVGVFSHEKEKGQNFYIDLLLYPGYSRASLSDDLSHTINYAEAADLVAEITRASKRDLIEALAGDIAEAVLRRFANLLAVDVRVHKPEAPVGHKLGDISFSLRRYRRNEVCVALGSNLGDREKILESALASLKKCPEISHLRASKFYETKAWGKEDQADFLNGVVLFETSLNPYALLSLLQKIEEEHGRVRKEKWGPRTLDLDIIFYGNYSSFDDDLRLPHPYCRERDFVTIPLRELREKSLTDTNEIRLYEKEDLE